MRFLFVHPVLSSRGGAQLALAWLLKGLAARGHAVKLFTSEDPERLAEPLARDGVRVVVRPVAPGFGEPGLLELGRSLQQEARDVDLVVAGNFPATVWAGFAKERLGSFPPLMWYANEPPRFLYERVMSRHFLGSAVDPKFYFPWSMAWKRRKNRPLVRIDQKAVGQIKEIMAISKQTAYWIKEIYQREAGIIPLGIGDMTAFPAFTEPESPFTFLSPAGLEPIKNFKTVLIAFARVLPQLPDRSGVRLLLTGEGVWRAEAEKTARRIRISQNVTFAGRVSREALRDFYRKCGAVVYVPLDEPFGLISCEAGLACKPVIASAHGGPSEVVLAQVTGLLVDPLNPDDIARAMLALAKNPDLRRKMGEAGRDRIVSRFGFEALLDAFQEAARRISFSV